MLDGVGDALVPESERIASNVNDLEVDFDPAKWVWGWRGACASRMQGGGGRGNTKLALSGTHFTGFKVRVPVRVRN